MKIVQIGANRGNDELTNYLFSNYEIIDFGLFVEANPIHIDELKKCYDRYENIIVDNVAIKLPSHNNDVITIYYHTGDPGYEIASCNIDHIKSHMEYSSFLDSTGGTISSFEINCITLDQLFEKYSIHELDILFLDIEGIDAEVLLTFDWEKYHIKRVEFEQIHLGNYRNAVKNMMIGMGYIQTSSMHVNNWAFEMV